MKVLQIDVSSDFLSIDAESFTQVLDVGRREKTRLQTMPPKSRVHVRARRSLSLRPRHMNELESRDIEVQFVQIILHHLHRCVAVLERLHVTVLVKHESLCFLEVSRVSSLQKDNASAFGILSKELCDWIGMAEEDFLQSICLPITDDTRLRELREDVSRMCRNDCPSFFPGTSMSG